MSTDDVLLLRRDAHFYIDKVCGTFPFTHQQNEEGIRDEEGGPTAYSRYVKGLLMKVYDALYFIINRTRRKYRRRRERADDVLLLRRGPLDKVYGALYAFCPSLD